MYIDFPVVNISKKDHVGVFGDFGTESDEAAFSLKSGTGSLGNENTCFSPDFIPSLSSDSVSNNGAFSLVTEEVSGVVGGVSTSSKEGQLLGSPVLTLLKRSFRAFNANWLKHTS